MKTKAPRQRIKISLKLSKKALRALRTRVNKTGKDYLEVRLHSTDLRGGYLWTNKKKLVRGKKRRR